MKNGMITRLPTVFFVLFLCLSFKVSFAGDGSNDKPYFKQIESLRSESKPKLFSFDLDVQLGLSFSKSNFNLNKVDSNTSSLNNTTSKVGPCIGATVSLNLLGFGFSTGFIYSAKGFQQTGGSNYNLHYFVVPWLIYFDINFSRFRINGNFGPYAGILLTRTTYSAPNGNEVFMPKNVDIGLTGNIQGTYYFTKILGVLLGVKYEYGGLNNLVSNPYINSMHTSTLFTYTGLKISI